jgi:dienelactone hydrolase
VTRRFALLLALLTGLLALLSACSSGSSGSTWTFDFASERGPYSVGVTTVEFLDTTRPTEPNRDVPGSNERRLTVEVWYPADAPAAEPEVADAPLDGSGGPYPLIVFSHGLTGSRRQSVSYTQHLASHGYIVASPDFPLSNGGAPGGPRLFAVISQPEDVSFVIDKMLEFDGQDGHLLHSAIDEERIGLTGHSLGALTTYLTAYGPKRDERVKAALPISIPGCFFPEGLAGDTSIPMMLLTGSDDLVVPSRGSERSYGIANAPKYLVILDGADHIRFADFDGTDRAFQDALQEVLASAAVVEDSVAVVDAFGGGDLSYCVGAEDDGGALVPAERQRELLRAFSTPFFAAYLRGDEDALKFLQDELPGLVPEATTFDYDAP